MAETPTRRVTRSMNQLGLQTPQPQASPSTSSPQQHEDLSIPDDNDAYFPHVKYTHSVAYEVITVHQIGGRGDFYHQEEGGCTDDLLDALRGLQPALIQPRTAWPKEQIHRSLDYAKQANSTVFKDVPRRGTFRDGRIVGVSWPEHCLNA
jgi:hypothetical protein